ncbi:MAG: hypothetical protein II103_04215, partial [Treponema sp.]|nr:hypothetical protein [Treponema sp.]
LTNGAVTFVWSKLNESTLYFFFSSDIFSSRIYMVFFLIFWTALPFLQVCPSKKRHLHFFSGLSGVPRDQAPVKQAAPRRARHLLAQKAGEFSQKTHG